MEDGKPVKKAIVSFIYSSVHVSMPTSLIYPSPLSPGLHKFVFYICYSTSVLYVKTFAPPFFQIPHIGDITSVCV